MRNVVLMLISLVVAMALSCGGGGSDSNGGGSNGGNGSVDPVLCEEACTNQAAVCAEDGADFVEPIDCINSCTNDDSPQGEQGAECLAQAQSCAAVGECIAQYYEDGGVPGDDNDDECWPDPPAGQEVDYTGSWALATPDPVAASDDLFAANDPVAMAIDSNQQPVVAVVDDSGDTDVIRVHHWDGNNWTDLETLASRESVDLYGLVVDGDDRPVIAWVDREFQVSDGSLLHLQAWTGTQWEELGSLPGFEPNPGVTDLDIIVDDQGEILVAAKFATTGGDLVVFRWDGSSWTAVGDTDLSGNSAAPYVDEVHLSASADGSLYASWVSKADENNIIVVEKWDGSTWEVLGSDPVITDGVGDMALRNTTAARASSDGSVYVVASVTPDPDNVTGRVGTLALVWDGSTWTRIGGDRCITGSMEQDVAGVATLETLAGFDLVIDSHGAPIFATAQPVAFRLASDGYFHHLGDSWAFSGDWDEASVYTSGVGKAMKVSGDTLFGLVREEESGERELGYYVKTYDLSQ